MKAINNLFILILACHCPVKNTEKNRWLVNHLYLHSVDILNIDGLG